MSCVLVSAACVSFSDPKGDDDDGGNLRPVATVIVPDEAFLSTTVLLDASGSQDPDAESGNGIAEYHWELLDRPPGSTAGITGAELGQFFVDVGGTYSGTLRVVDADGAISDAVDFDVVTPTAFNWEFELTWDTADTDFDLHVVSLALTTSATGIGAIPGDCHYASKTQDWPPLGVPEGDCRMVSDDLNGYGPELVVVTNGGFTYRALAHWYGNTAAVPGTTATLRVYREGEVLYEQSRTLGNVKDAWNIVTVSSNGLATEVDTVFTHDPS